MIGLDLVLVSHLCHGYSWVERSLESSRWGEREMTNGWEYRANRNFFKTAISTANIETRQLHVQHSNQDCFSGLLASMLYDFKFKNHWSISHSNRWLCGWIFAQNNFFQHYWFYNWFLTINSSTTIYLLRIPNLKARISSRNLI